MAESSILVATPSFAAGVFLCPPDDARWHEENWIGPSHVLAFPRRAVVIVRARRERVVANPNHVVLYNPDETYRRDLLAPEGDESAFIQIEPEAARELLPDEGSVDRPRFPVLESDVSDRAALRLHALELWIRNAFTRTGRNRPAAHPPATEAPGPSPIDPLAADERLAAIVRDVAATAHPARDARSVSERVGPVRPATAREHRALVSDARELLSVAYPEPLTLADIACRVGASPFHLARSFRRLTGQTLHGYRERLRLREALRRLGEGEEDLARLATDVGFASHSHFDDRFRLAFGVPPSAARALRGPGATRNETGAGSSRAGRATRPAFAIHSVADQLRTISEATAGSTT
jgi:AraC-like DNA-binding protein